MKILIDAMGGDHAPDEIVKGAALAAAELPHEILLVGDKARIEAALEAAEQSGAAIPPEARPGIIHASEVITGEDSPVKAVRQKKDSSLVKGMEALGAGEVDLFMSAGNSGAILSGSVFVLGRVKGIDRPAIGSTYPILSQGRAALLIDTGANAECKPSNLLQFAVMGSYYAEGVLGIEKPKVGLVNIGTEPGKGTAMLKDAYNLLEEAKEQGTLPGFIGNIEARDIPIGIADVIVCDGFVGNIVLKMTEGMALSIAHLMKAKFTDGIMAKAGSVLLYSKLNELKDAFDYTEYGGAPILGVKGAVIKMHGSADAQAVKKAVIKAVPFMEGGIVSKIEAKLGKNGRKGEDA